MKFVCAHCGRQCRSEWSEEEAAAEAVALFGAFPTDPVAICDDCYRAFLAWVAAKGLLP